VVGGPAQGKQQTYALLAERAPEARSLDTDEALVELTRRYFTSRGPATLKDYVWWSSLTVAQARRGIEMLGSELESELVQDTTFWFTGSTPPFRRRSPVVDLIQGYDEYIVSYTESWDVLFQPGAPRRPPLFYHAILLDGLLIGHWHHALEKRRVVVETQLHRSLERAEKRALESAVERYGRFVGRPAVMV